MAKKTFSVSHLRGFSPEFYTKTPLVLGSEESPSPGSVRVYEVNKSSSDSSLPDSIVVKRAAIARGVVDIGKECAALNNFNHKSE